MLVYEQLAYVSRENLIILILIKEAFDEELMHHMFKLLGNTCFAIIGLKYLRYY